MTWYGHVANSTILLFTNNRILILLTLYRNDLQNTSNECSTMNLSTKNKQYLLHKDPTPGHFYILPKIHKVNNPSRPAVSSNNHPTERISQFVDFHLKPLVYTTPSCVKNTTDFLNKLTAIDNLPDNALLVSLHVMSLYTNIPHNEGIDACRFLLQKRTNKHIPTETICDLIRIIPTMNNLKDRFNEYRRPIFNPTGNYIHTAVSEYFLTSNHFDNHMLLIPVEKLKNGRDSFRKAREAHLIHKAKAMESLGINKRDEL